jgi:hypothetical protein
MNAIPIEHLTNTATQTTKPTSETTVDEMLSEFTSVMETGTGRKQGRSAEDEVRWEIRKFERRYSLMRKERME